MTYQKPHDDDVKVEEATSLLSGQGGGGVPAGTKKNGVPTMRAMIVTTASVFLGTLAVVIYGGRGGSSHTSSGGISVRPIIIVSAIHILSLIIDVSDDNLILSFAMFASYSFRCDDDFSQYQDQTLTDVHDILYDQILGL